MRKISHFALLIILILPAVQAVLGAEIEMTSKVTAVHDGDTFTMANGEKVRLADLNAPELGDAGSYEARDYLGSLVDQKTVYLDVDDLYQTDSYGRFVCVVYVDYNSTHLLNVNKALIDGGYAEARNYQNEFNYNTFTMFVLKTQLYQPDNGNIPSSLISAVIIFAAIMLVVLLIIRKRR